VIVPGTGVFTRGRASAVNVPPPTTEDLGQILGTSLILTWAIAENWHTLAFLTLMWLPSGSWRSICLVPPMIRWPGTVLS